MYFIGAHVSAAGGPANAVTNAMAIGATAFAFFPKNQHTWTAPPLKEEQISAFKTACSSNHFTAAQILPHASYIINLANPDKEKRQKGFATLVLEMQRCAQLGLDRLVMHPGSTIGKIDLKEGIQNIAQCLDEATDQVPTVKIALETTAGQGSEIGCTFEQLAALRDCSKAPKQLGICLDTCHIFAAGYDITTQEAFAQTLQSFEKTIGFEHLLGVHLNDAKNPLASHVDRHASIGEGYLGWDPFKWLIQDNRFENIPLILETTDDGLWAQEINTLRSFIKKD